MSWAPEVLVDGKWSGNALRFATEAEAERYGHDLLMRWFVPTDSRAVKSRDPVNYEVLPGGGIQRVVLSWRKVPRSEDGNETGWSATYEASDEHGIGGRVVRTGRYGSDDYPWDWHITPLHPAPEGVRVRTGGSADTLRSAKDQAEQAARLTR